MHFTAHGLTYQLISRTYVELSPTNTDFDWLAEPDR